MKVDLLDRANLAELLLRLGLSFAFFYAGIAALAQPDSWAGFVPAWIGSVIAIGMFLKIHAVVQILLAAAILLLPNPFYPALLAAGAMAGVVISNLAIMDVVFRDISIMFAALALASLSRPENLLLGFLSK